MEQKSLNHHRIERYKVLIQNFLNECRVGSGSNIKSTHISLGSFQGKFYLNEDQYDDFMKKYAEAVEYGVELNIAEKPKDYGPLLVDVDLEIPIEDKKNARLYDYDMIIQIIDIYRDGIKNYLDVSDEELEVSIFEKPSPSEKGVILKDGIHLIFHNTCIHFKLRHLIRKFVVDKLKELNVLSGFTKDADSIIDKAVVSTNYWLLYGSKKPDGQLYSLTKILNENNETMNIENLKKEKLIKKYSLQKTYYCNDNSQPLISELEDEDIEILYNKLNDRISKKNNLFEDIKVSETKEDDIRIATFLVSILSNERAEDFDAWIRIGWALHNIDNSLLSLWIDFSKRSSKFKEGYCDEQWKKMRNDGLTIGSLMLWAEEDNFIKFHQFMDNEKKIAINISLNGSTYNIAKALYCIYRNRFVCASFKSNDWYEFKNHKWVQVPEGFTLKKEISENFINEYSKLVSNYSLKSINEETSDKEETHKKVSKIQSIVEKLLNITFKDKIMKEAETLFFDPEFYKKLDENYDLIGFNNGVYDLLNEEFRDGRPDDFISKSTKVDYYDFDKSNPFAKKMLTFFEEILPNKDVRDYVLLTLSTCISGHNKEEKFNILTGSGSNGKSLLFNLIQLALGDYYISCPITIVTRKRSNAGQASPELARIKGVRCGLFSETEDDEKLNVGIIKEITGNDSFMARGLYSDPIEIKPQIKFFLACNQMPSVPSTDGGTWRRLLKIDFNSKFVENPKKSNEFLIDNTLKLKIKEWAPVFTSYLINLYVKEYKLKEYLHVPDVIKYSTDEYKLENDFFTEYFMTKLVITENKKDRLSEGAIFEDFKFFMINVHTGNEKKINKVELHKYLVNKLGDNGGKPWKYIAFRNDKEEESSDDDDNEHSVLG